MISAALLTGHLANAGGLDRTGLPIGIIFQDGNYAEITFANTSPSVTGTDLLGNPIGNVGASFRSFGGGIKLDLSDSISVALIAEEPYGSDVTYPGSGAATLLGGTSAVASSQSLTAVGRYKFNERFSAHAGVRHQSIEGDITLSGLAYGGLSGYNVALSKGSGTGFLVGAAYEIPEYALRVAVTYNSKIDHDLPFVETNLPSPPLPPTIAGTTTVTSPASINLDVQTGINENTLLFGSVRYAKWSDLKISPTGFDAAVDPTIPGSSISDIEDSFNYTVGVGRKINEQFSVSASVGYEPEGTDDLVSPLAPSNGNWSIGLGAQYKTEAVTISGGVRYTKLGDARPETGTPDTARANFTDNSAVSVGMKIGFNF
ncbi:Outer membrane transporter, OMPP1/FadL/TodX family [Candidatus Rhodobacter oscarellae]|uniref:Outer membrane transporter, OMPP1/FadL/TodX family n=1 Tax=Candidatus Rhodobacter oscarellae TaxID=1675527 RepID=A0A0J9GTS1_9RHOB|nr:Outer membrane transporter, OMPP1/FadL/TodX family [Candidatus Rhodobacter lobularis]